MGEIESLLPCTVTPNPGGWAKQKQKKQMQKRVAYTAQGNLSRPVRDGDRIR